MVLREDRPIVRLELGSSPETLTLVRAMLGGVAEELSLDPELLDDLKTAVSEAANNVVMHAYGQESGPLWVSIYATSEGLEVVVRDRGQGIPPVTPADDRLQGVGIPIMRALAQQTAFRTLPEDREGRWLYRAPDEVALEDERVDRLNGDAVVSLSPVSFLGAVLGRLARALAARARFSLDRFSDVYLVTDALADYASQAASDSRICFCIATANRRMDVTVGPFRAGASAELAGEEPSDVASALRLLSDELEVRPENGTESLHLVMLDQRLRLSTPA
jgi:anti-sigma regulatory factor (Ser/Thr protein kinase)